MRFPIIRAFIITLFIKNNCYAIQNENSNSKHNSAANNSIFRQSSKVCNSKLDQVTNAIIPINQYIKSNKVYQCAEQEFIDPLLNLPKLKSFVLNECEKSIQCKDYLIQKISSISKLPEERFKELSTITLWGEVEKYSGLLRVNPPRLGDLPLEKDYESLFQQLYEQELANRELSKNETFSVVCSAFALVVGPGKLKPLAAIAKGTATGVKVARSVVRINPKVQKMLDKNKLPSNVKENFYTWMKKVETEGIHEVRKIPGYSDKQDLVNPELRNVRLNIQYRIEYSTEKVGDTEVLHIKNIHPHSYKN